MSFSCPLVWVHIGQAKIPKYLKVSLRNFSKTFPGQRLVLLVESRENLNTFEIPNLEVHQVSVLDDNWSTIKSKLQHDLHFRSEFWFNSLARFKAIYSFMQQNNVKELIHIESDVTFLPNFPFEKFHGLGSKLAYPIQGNNQGIAAILFVGSIEILQKFLKYCFDEVIKNPRSTDMTILFKFAQDNEDDVTFLPTIADIENSNLPAKELFNGAFDAISIGQYFFGIDARNSRGFRKLFRTDSTHWVQPDRFDFAWRGSSLFASRGTSELEVFSLHIHSKDVEAFQFDTLQGKFMKRYSESAKGERSEIVIRVVTKSAYAALIRRVRSK